METDIAILRGQLAAVMHMATVLTTKLTPLQAAQGAVELALSREDSRNEDASLGTTDIEAQSRDAIIEGWLGLLSTLAKAR